MSNEELFRRAQAAGLFEIREELRVCNAAIVAAEREELLFCARVDVHTAVNFGAVDLTARAEAAEVARDKFRENGLKETGEFSSHIFTFLLFVKRSPAARRWPCSREVRAG